MGLRWINKRFLMKKILLALFIFSAFTSYSQTEYIVNGFKHLSGITQRQKKFATSGVTSNTTSLIVTPDATPISGNLLVLIVVSNNTVTTPSGWTLAKSAIDNTGSYVFYKISAGTESSITVTQPSDFGTIAVMEYSGLTNVLDKTASAIGQGGSGTISTGTTAATTTANELIITVAGISQTNPGSITVTGWSNSLVSQGNAEATNNSSSTKVRMEVAAKVVSSTGTQTSTATLSATGGANDSGIIVTFK